MTEYVVTFTDGTKETVSAYRVKWDDSLVSFRTSHDTAYDEDWVRYPLAGVRAWRKASQ